MALDTCETTLNNLDVLIREIQICSHQPRTLLWKARIAVNINKNDADIIAYRDKIRQSNSVLQTILNALNL